MVDLWTDPSSLGDPAGMRALARSMQEIADEMTARIDHVDRKFASTTFEGPAENRIERNVTEDRRTVHEAAQRLKESANALLTSAANVEHAIQELIRRQEAAREVEARKMWT